MSRTIHRSILNEECSIFPVPEQKVEAPEPKQTVQPKGPVFKTPEKKAVKNGDLIRDAKIALEKSLCPCIIKKGLEQKICLRKVKANGRCGFHKTTCNRLEETLEPVQQAAALSEGEQLIVRAEMATKQGLCSCVVLARSGERRVCGNKIKNNGRCGIHQTKCLQAEELAKRKPVAVADEESDNDDEEPAPAPKIKVIEDIKVAEIQKDEKCPCILTSKMKAGEDIKICGKKIKANGRCGIHQRKCMLPEPPAEAKVPERDDILADFEDDNSPKRQDLENVMENTTEIVIPSVAENILDSEWNVKPIAGIEAVLNYLTDLEQKPKFNLLDLKGIDAQIEKCLSVN